MGLGVRGSHVRTEDEGASSSGVGRNPSVRGEPFYAPSLQAEIMAMFVICKLTYIRFSNMVCMVEQGFDFPDGLEAQGVNTFLELNGNIYPSLIREFYANFQFKDENYFGVVKGKLFTVDESVFLEVGGLAYYRSPILYLQDEIWNLDYASRLYESCLRYSHYYVQGELAKDG
ncbi:hypothetical protein Lal_00041728 [Lupinus albus]|nr:hypothetical protein Lal_00041728 [Lupinus albus]